MNIKYCTFHTTNSRSGTRNSLGDHVALSMWKQTFAASIFAYPTPSLCEWQQLTSSQGNTVVVTCYNSAVVSLKVKLKQNKTKEHKFAKLKHSSCTQEFSNFKSRCQMRVAAPSLLDHAKVTHRPCFLGHAYLKLKACYFCHLDVYLQILENNRI